MGRRTYPVVPCPEEFLAVVEGDGGRRPRKRRLVRAGRRKRNATDLVEDRIQQLGPCPEVRYGRAAYHRDSFVPRTGRKACTESIAFGIA